MAHKDLGFKLLERLVEELKEIIDVDQQPKSEGRTIFLIASPKKEIDAIIEDMGKRKFKLDRGYNA